MWNQQAEPLRTCSTLFQCYLAYTNEGMKNAGISGLIRDMVSRDQYPRHLWTESDLLALVGMDLTFFVVVIFVLAAFLNGVSVDTFGALRDAGHDDADKL